jgi:translation initiation factor IF-3
MQNPKAKVNGQIRAQDVRVVTEDGSELGVFALADACRLAQDRSLDLIEIGPNEQPPRCCLMDYGRYQWQQQQKAQGDGTPRI